MKTLITILFLSISSIMMAQDRMPNMKLKDMQGKTVSMQDISKDQLVVVSLWATWCVPCIKELEAIKDVYDEWQEETGVKIYAVTVDDSRTVKRVRPMVNGKDWDYDIVFDTNNDFKRAVGASAIPMLFVAKDNEILYRRNGYAPGAEDELFEKLQELSN